MRIYQYIQGLQRDLDLLKRAAKQHLDKQSPGTLLALTNVHTAISDKREECSACRCNSYEPGYGCHVCDHHVREHEVESEKHTNPLREAVRWVLNDALYKAPEQMGECDEVWLARLRSALELESK